MLSVLFSFIIIGLLTTAVGAGTLDLILRLCGTDLAEYGKVSFAGLSITGLAAAAVYAQYWSIFGGVGGAAFIVFVLLGILAGILHRKYIGEIWRGLFCDSAFQAGGSARIALLFRCVLLIFVFLLCALAASGGYPHFDTDLYHAQSIRWIEEYGAIKGLANLHNRLGYNSAAFTLTALFSGSFILPQSLHTVSGYLAMLILGKCLLGIKRASFGKLSLFIRLAGVWYTCNVLKEIGSPSSDPFMVLIAIYIVLRFAEEAERGNGSGYGFLALLCVFNVTIKLSSAGLLMIAVYPAVILIKNKEWKKIAALILAGILTVLPYLIRNIILSGYLVYPFPGLDLFNVEWKVPYGAALSDAREITAWGKGLREVALAEAPLSVWFLPWLRSQGKFDQIMFCAAVIPALPIVILLIREPDREVRKIRLFMELVLLAAFLFWFTSSPLMRYGCIFCYLLAFFHLGILYEYMKTAAKESRLRKLIYNGAAVLSVLLIGYKLGGAVMQQAAFRYDFHPVWQMDYGVYETDTYLLDGVTIYYPVNGNQTGYAAFPSSPTVRAGRIRLLGEDIPDGFAVINAGD